MAQQSKLAIILGLAGSSLAVSGLRFIASFFMRAVLDPITVGIVNAMQLLAVLLGPVSLGDIYRSLRRLPTFPPHERAGEANSALRTSVLEGIVLAGLIVPFLLPQMTETSPGPLLLIATGILTISVRVLAIQESLLQALQAFRAVAIARFIRAAEPYLGALMVVLTGSVPIYAGAGIMVAIACLWFGKKVIHRPAAGETQPLSPWQRLRNVDRYGLLTAGDRIVSTLANYCDPLLVVSVAGPSSLAGYYLGISVRGALLNLPNAVFWERWADAVRIHDDKGPDHFTRLRFLGILWAAMIAALLTATALLWFAVRWVIPDYAGYLPEMTIASAVAVPYALSTMLRGKAMIERNVGRMMLISTLRICAFALLLALLNHVMGRLDAVTVAAAGYGGAAIECLVFAADLAVRTRRFRFLAGILFMCVAPGVAIAPLFIR